MNEQLSFQFDVKEDASKVSAEPTLELYKPAKKSNIEQYYYSIGEVAKELKVSPSLIRYWESEFTSLKPKKNSNGIRKFTKKDIVLLREIYQLVKEKGFTIQGAKDALKKDKKEEQKKEQLIGKLQKIRTFLIDLKDTLL